MTTPFEGVRILDFTVGVAGPMAAMLFADYGADVVKVEPPGGYRLRDDAGYLTWNRNKRRIVVDLHTYEGQRTAKELLSRADVAMFDALPGELERLGLDGGTLTAANPRLIHAWLPPYGTKGRWSFLPFDDLLRDAVTGIAHLQFSFEDQPVALVTPQVGYAHATIAANGIAAALWERRASGLGQALTVSGLHAVSAIEGGGAISAGGAVRLARTSRGAAHYGLYRCADDRWFFLGCLTAPFFLRALEALDLMEVMAWEGVDGEFTNLLRVPETAVRLRETLEAKFITEPRAHWMEVLQAAGVPKGPSGIREEWFRDETVAANEMRLVLDHPELGEVEMPGIPVKLSETPGCVRHFLQESTPEAVLDVWSPRPASDTPSLRDSGTRPLEGVRILDLGAFIAGTFAPTVLANYGADVIKVEPVDGDPFRPYGLLFTGHNLGKRSVALDIKHPAGRAAFEDLVRSADVVLDNFRLGVRERLCIDYTTLSRINPRIITCSVTGYGPVGPLAADPGFDPLLQSRSGMMMAQGGAEPVFHQIAVNDTGTAMMAAFGIQAALHARETTGRGQEVQTCLANQSVLFQSGELTHFAGRRPAPTGGQDYIGASALRRYYECADGWLVLACTEAAHFHAAAVALGHPEWAGRIIAERALDEPADGQLATSIAETLGEMARDEAVDRLRARAVPAAPVLRAEQLFSDPWLRENEFFQEFDEPLFGRVTSVRTYAEWSCSRGGFARMAPGVGEQSGEVLAEAGVSAARIAELFGEGIAVQG